MNMDTMTVTDADMNRNDFPDVLQLTAVWSCTSGVSYSCAAWSPNEHRHDDCDRC